MTTVGEPARAATRGRRAAPRADLPFINRELSWLDFNERVLYQAEDARNPLLERVRFLTIFASNLDEFFQVRVAGLKQQVAAGHSRPTPDGLSASEKLERIRVRVLQLQARTPTWPPPSARSWPRRASASCPPRIARSARSSCGSASWTRSSRS